MEAISAKETVDCKGLHCPMPIVKSRKAIDHLASGDVLEVLATDKGSVKDFQAWVKSTGNILLNHEEENGVFRFYVQKA